MEIYIHGNIANPQKTGQDEYMSCMNWERSELDPKINENMQLTRRFNSLFEEIECVPTIGSMARIYGDSFRFNDKTGTLLCFSTIETGIKFVVLLTPDEFEKLYGSQRFMGFSTVPHWAYNLRNLRSEVLAKEIFPDFYHWWDDVKIPEIRNVVGAERIHVAVIIDMLMSKIEDDKNGISTLPIGIFYENSESFQEDSQLISEEERLKILRRMLCLAINGLPSKISRDISFNCAARPFLKVCDVFCSRQNSSEFKNKAICYNINSSVEVQTLEYSFKHPYAQYIAESIGDPCEHLEGIESIQELDQSVKVQKLLHSANEIRDSINCNRDIDTTNLSNLLRSYSNIQDKKVKTELQIILKEIAFRIYFFNFDAFAKWSDINLLETFLYSQEGLFVAPDESYLFLRTFSVEHLDAIFYRGIHQDTYKEYVSFLRHCEQNKEGNFELVNTISDFLHVFSEKRLGNEKLMQALASYLVDAPLEEIVDYISRGIDILSSDIIISKLKGRFDIIARKDFCDKLKMSLPQDDIITTKYKQFVNSFYKVDTSVILEEMAHSSERSKSVYASYSHTIKRKQENTGMQKNGNRGWIVAFDILIAILFLSFYALGAPAFTAFMCSKIFAVGAVAYSQNVNKVFAVLMVLLSIAAYVWHIFLISKYDRITLRICVLYLFCSIGLLSIYFCFIFGYFFFSVVV